MIPRPKLPELIFSNLFFFLNKVLMYYLLQVSDRGFFSIVKIARCKVKRWSFDKLNGQSTPMHRETLLLVWDSTKLKRTVIKERL